MASLGQRSQISVSLIDNAEHCPPSRLLKGGLAILSSSIALHGQQTPILVYKSGGGRFTISKGHRRVEAHRINDWPTVDAIVVEAKMSDMLYGTLNVAQKRLTGNELLYVWLHNKAAVHEKFTKELKEMEKVCGRLLMAQIYEAGHGYSIFNKALALASYINMNDIQRVVRFMIKYPSRDVMSSIIMEIDPRKVKAAINQDRQFKLDWRAKVAV